ncbi:MAG: hypothetical protein HY901_13300 [Deltaproteobacteria bacterium]|nr:hypothetical protein [Deltaproteobacteria bacterium]
MTASGGHFGVLASHARLRPCVTPRSPKKQGRRERERTTVRDKLPLVQRQDWNESSVGELRPLLKARPS